jgi:hypothetical protein
MADSQQLQQFAVIILKGDDIKDIGQIKKGEPNWIPL